MSALILFSACIAVLVVCAIIAATAESAWQRDWLPASLGALTLVGIGILAIQAQTIIGATA